MVCDKCEKKLGKVITPDPWKSGARNTTESGGRKVNENKALTATKNRFNPYTKSFEICRICKQKVHQAGSHYCQSCAYKKEAGRSDSEVPEELWIQLKDEAQKCLNADTAAYNIRNMKSNSNFQWMKTMMSKGVISDKVAAYVVTIQDNPIYSIDSLSNLTSMVKVGKKQECITIIESLVELFLESLLVPNRKLIPFRLRPLTKLNELSSGNVITRKKYLTYWLFEEQLKEIYATFVLALNTVAQDTVEKNKEKAIGAMKKLLAGNSEQEQNLLKYIVNKLGDPSKKIASKVIYSLGSLLNQHSNMQGVVLDEIEKVLFRTNISTRAQYYALCFLTQFYLNHDTREIARHLIEVYFSFFKACVKKGEVNSRMMSALLMGVNRAYPYAKMEMDKVSGHIDTMYRIAHIANFNVSLHALRLLHQISSNEGTVSDRFVSALYKKLPDPHINNTFHQAMLLALVYKTLAGDKQIDRTKVLIKRLLQIAIYSQPSMACGVLYVVSQLIRKNRDLSAIVLFESGGDADFADDDDDEEEKYFDVKDDQVENTSTTEDKTTPSWQFKHKKLKTVTCYNGMCRNPLYGGGQYCAYTELSILKNHFHPTVSLFATNLLNEQTINYTGDPLKDFSLIRFLDRFVFKNPKRAQDRSKEGVQTVLSSRKNYVPKGIRSVAVQSNTYLNNEEKNIPIEELFLYNFLQKRNRVKVDDGDEDDLDSVGSDEFDEMLDKMSKSKHDDDDLNFMDEIEEGFRNKKNRKKTPEEDNQEEEEEDELDDEELIDEDDDFSDLEFNSNSDEDEDLPVVNDSKKKKKDAVPVFASAEEFASLLEEEGASKIAPGGSNAWANKDNAHLHQISWEEKRNQWLKGYGKSKDKSKGGFKHGKPQKRKQTNHGKNKKKRKG
ncbi:hypothetical protein FQR65_LT02199 [Abscondita terminalis]|nr:hypothetical protein FQR65_LT02199 [Abscondita terminalis]